MTKRRSAADWSAAGWLEEAVEGEGGAGFARAVGVDGPTCDAQPPIQAIHPAMRAVRAHFLYDRPMRDDAVLGNDHNAVANVVMSVIHLLRLARG